MYKKLNTIWVTVLTLTALTLSSVASGASLMPLQMANNQQMTMASAEHDSHCDTVVVQAKAEQQECCGSDSMSSEHQCCPSTCVATYTAVTPGPAYNSLQPSSLVLIARELSGHTSAVSNALFRPPIA